MNREEAIKELQESHDMMRSYDIDSSESRLMTALNMAIKALEQEPCDTCGYEEGSIYCKEHCPHEAKIEQESCGDAIDRAVSLNAVKDLFCRICMESNLCYRSKETCEDLRLFDKLTPVNPTKTGWIPVSEKYEHHIDHTDCIWYGNDSGCPVTCSQYRDGWNDAMDYIFKNGKGYQPYRHDG